MPEQLEEAPQAQLESVATKRASVAERAGGPVLQTLTENVLMEREERSEDRVPIDLVSGVARAMQAIPGGGMRRVPGSER